MDYSLNVGGIILRIAILSCDPSLYSCQRLKEAALVRGHKIDIIDPLSCYINVNCTAPGIYVKGDVLAHYDVVIPRIGSTITVYGTSILRQFELVGTFTLNRAEAIIKARNKLLSLQLLAQQGVDLPITGFVHHCHDSQDAITRIGGAPLVIKLLEGSQGIGVILAETNQAAASIVDAFRSLNTPILLQEYIQESQGEDIRCLVIGQQVVGAIARQAKKGEFRSNLHCGGSARPVEITLRERQIALKAVATLGLCVAGVDILRSHRGPLVMEVNASPGLEGVENISGKDIAGMMVDYIEKVTW